MKYLALLLPLLTACQPLFSKSPATLCNGDCDLGPTYLSHH